MMGPALPSCRRMMAASVSGRITAVRASCKLSALPFHEPTGSISRTMFV